MKRFWRNWRERARGLKTETRALALVCRDPRVPTKTRVLALCVVAYALSPIDLIPDFIPVFGLLDDMILLPLGIALVLKTVPPDVLQECRERAKATEKDSILGRFGAVLIVALWLLFFGFLLRHFL